MKALKFLFAIILVAAFAATAMAANVTINGQSQVICTSTLTLGGLQVDSGGNVALTVTCGGGPCTPSSASASPSSIALGTISPGSTAPAQTVNIRDNCLNSLGYTASVTSGGNWISVPPSGTGTMSVTFNTAGLAVGTYPGTIAVTPAGYSLINIAVNLTVSSVPVCPPSNVIQYNTGYQSFTIAPNQTQLWYGTLAADCATSSKQLRFSITQQQNAPNVNMVVKKTNGDCTTPPTIVDYNSLMNQFGYATGTKTPDGVYFEAFSAIATGETLVIGPASAYLSKYPNFGTQADTYYVLLVNTTGSQAAGNINFYCY